MKYAIDHNRNKAVFLDRDGVINRERGEYTFNIEDFILNDGLTDFLKKVKELGYLIIVISNQGGIAKKLYTKDQADEIHRYMKDILSDHDIHITQVYYCPHHPDIENCICRKPNSLLFEKALAKYHLNPDLSFMIGDKDRDLTAAALVHIHGIKIKPNDNLINYLNLISESV